MVLWRVAADPTVLLVIPAKAGIQLLIFACNDKR
jgi:hypothetical protein